MKIKRKFNRDYMGIDQWEPGSCAGPRYANSKEDVVVDKLRQLCIEDKSFFWYSEGSLLKIDVYSHMEKPYEQKYIRILEIQIMPPKDLPKELSDLLNNMGFKEIKE